MNETNVIKLVEAFPQLYGSFFNFACGDGWFNILFDLSEKLYEIKEKTSEEIKIEQIKAKLGGLRFHASYSSQEVYEAIQDAIKASYEICEECGKPGQLRSKSNWAYTLCAEHYKEK